MIRVCHAIIVQNGKFKRVNRALTGDTDMLVQDGRPVIWDDKRHDMRPVPSDQWQVVPGGIEFDDELRDRQHGSNQRKRMTLTNLLQLQEQRLRSDGTIKIPAPVDEDEKLLTSILDDLQDL